MSDPLFLLPPVTPPHLGKAETVAMLSSEHTNLWQFNAFTLETPIKLSTPEVWNITFRSRVLISFIEYTGITYTHSMSGCFLHYTLILLPG